MGLLRIQLRRLRAEGLAGVVLVVLVFFTAFGLAVGPRLLERLANEALITELSAAPSIERNVVVTESARSTAPLLDGLAGAQGATANVEAQLPAEIRPLVSERRFVADSGPYSALSGTQFAAFLILRIQQDVEQHVDLLSGRLPTGQTEVVAGDGPDQTVTLYEAMLSESTADEMGLAAGDTVPLGVPSPGATETLAQVRVVGIYRVRQPNEPFWMDDSLVRSFRYHPIGSNFVAVEADAILAPEAFGALQEGRNSGLDDLVYQWRYYLDMQRLDATRAEQLAEALRRVESKPPRSGVSDQAADTLLRSGLLRFLLDHQATWQAATILLAVVATGALFVAGTCLALVVALTSTGRRRTGDLLLARGAPARRIRATLAAETTLLAVPAAVLAAAAAVVAVPSASVAATLAAAILVATLAVVLVSVIGFPGGRGRNVRAGADEWTAPGALTRPSGRRLVVEAALVIAAVSGAYLLRQRGLTVPAGSSVATADPLMIVVPALIGLAAGVVALRIFPPITNAVARLTARGRGVVLVLAARRAARGATGAAVLLALVATASVAGFAGAAYNALDQAVVVGGWQTIGAPFRVTTLADGLPPDFDPATLPGVTGSARAWVLDGLGPQHRPASIIALDTAAYQQLNAGSPADPGFSAELLSPTKPKDGALPALMTHAFGFGSGNRGAITIEKKPVTLRAATIVDSFPLEVPNPAWALVSAAQLEAYQPGILGKSSAVFLMGDDRTAEALAAAAASDTNLVVTSRTEVGRALSTLPVVGAVRAGLAAIVTAAAAYAALALIAALILSALMLKTETAYLAVLGVSRSQRLRMIFAEHVPAAVVAAVFGGLLGFGVFVFVRSGLGLGTIMSNSADIPLAVDARQLAGLIVLALLVILPAWAVAAFAQREPDPAAAVREGSA